MLPAALVVSSFSTTALNDDKSWLCSLQLGLPHRLGQYSSGLLVWHDIPCVIERSVCSLF